jgi:hypothetical protein
MPGKCDVSTPPLEPVGEKQLVSCYLYQNAEVAA